MRHKAVWVIAGLALIVVDGQAQRPLAPIDWKRVDQGLGRPGALQPDGAYTVGLPRGDLHVTVAGVAVKPTLALGSWVGFMQVSDSDAMLMGDLVLLESEIAPVLGELQEGGIEETALHNHLLQESPHVMYMHIAGRGTPAMCMYITWGDSCSRWLCSAVSSIPPSWSSPRTGAISLSSRTRSPMSMASESLTCMNPTHEPSARVGLTATPATVTWRSPRGRPTVYAPSGCSAPGLPSPWSTRFQSMGASGRCACPSTTIRASPAMTHTALCR